MSHFFKITESDLVQIQANELKANDIFYRKDDNGHFERCQVDLDWYKTEFELKAFKIRLKKDSIDGRLYFRRDKRGQDFKDCYIIKT